jgi:hypothetical protein
MFWPFGRRTPRVRPAPVSAPAPPPLLELSTRLLQDAPVGCYLLERVGAMIMVWRISEGEPAEDALDPALLHTPWATLPDQASSLRGPRAAVF